MLHYAAILTVSTVFGRSFLKTSLDARKSKAAYGCIRRPDTKDRLSHLDSH